MVQIQTREKQSDQYVPHKKEIVMQGQNVAQINDELIDNNTSEENSDREERISRFQVERDYCRHDVLNGLEKENRSARSKRTCQNVKRNPAYACILVSFLQRRNQSRVNKATQRIHPYRNRERNNRLQIPKIQLQYQVGLLGLQKSILFCRGQSRSFEKLLGQNSDTNPPNQQTTRMCLNCFDIERTQQC